MNAQRPIQRIIVLLALSLTFAPAASAELTLIYTASFDLRIPAEPATGDAWMDDAVIDIPDSFTVIDLDVEITLTHTNIYDLQLFLDSPDGTRLTLNYYDITGEFGENYTGTIFDDEADTPIESALPPFNGRYRPKAPAELSIFDHRDPQGAWTIQIYDARHNNIGELEEIKLTFKTPEPATILIMTLGIPILLRPRKKTLPQ